jgi:hypothetical protein
MSVNLLRAKAAHARRKVESLVRRQVESLVRRPVATGECVLVVYDKTEASIYFENGQEARPSKRP